ncbi:hypothetical protein GCM10009078_25140 [Cupriavidus gilardii]
MLCFMMASLNGRNGMPMRQPDQRRTKGIAATSGQGSRRQTKWTRATQPARTRAKVAGRRAPTELREPERAD